MERILVFLMVLSVFLDEFIVGASTNEARAQMPFDLYYYYFIYLVFLIHYMVKRKAMPFWPRWFAIPILILFGISIGVGNIEGTFGFPMIKQLLGITYSSIAYFSLVKYTGFDLQRIFRLYLRISYWVAVWAILEQVMRLLHFDLKFKGGGVESLLRFAGFWNLFDNSKAVSLGLYRSYSIMGEPYFLAVALIPALYYYLSCFIGPRHTRNWTHLRSFLVVLFGYLFTFSSAGYIGLGLMFAFLLLNWGFLNFKHGRILFLPLILLIIIPRLDSFKNIFKELTIRIDDTLKAFTSTKKLSKNELAKLNSSTFALFSNFMVAQKSFEKRPLTGSGLGSHEISYDLYFEELLGKRFKIIFGKFNTKDANSLFIRLMSETGIIGIAAFLFFLLRFAIGRKPSLNPDLVLLVLMNQGIFIMFVVRLMRTGNYLGQGFFLFFFLFAYSAIQIRREMTQSRKKLNPAQPGIAEIQETESK
ncbi:MAG: hypothetical protein JNL57_00870 [Bacteroidetes bacterium]|nr:hypothetical protein [Bacteroidota bacterium]